MPPDPPPPPIEPGRTLPPLTPPPSPPLSPVLPKTTSQDSASQASASGTLTYTLSSAVVPPPESAQTPSVSTLTSRLEPTSSSETTLVDVEDLYGRRLAGFTTNQRGEIVGVNDCAVEFSSIPVDAFRSRTEMDDAVWKLARSCGKILAWRPCGGRGGFERYTVVYLHRDAAMRANALSERHMIGNGLNAALVVVWPVYYPKGFSWYRVPDVRIASIPLRGREDIGLAATMAAKFPDLKTDKSLPQKPGKPLRPLTDLRVPAPLHPGWQSMSAHARPTSTPPGPSDDTASEDLRPRSPSPAPEPADADASSEAEPPIPPEGVVFQHHRWHAGGYHCYASAEEADRLTAEWEKWADETEGPFPAEHPFDTLFRLHEQSDTVEALRKLGKERQGPGKPNLDWLYQDDQPSTGLPLILKQMSLENIKRIGLLEDFHLLMEPPKSDAVKQALKRRELEIARCGGESAYWGPGYDPEAAEAQAAAQSSTEAVAESSTDAAADPSTEAVAEPSRDAVAESSTEAVAEQSAAAARTAAKKRRRNRRRR